MDNQICKHVYTRGEKKAQQCDSKCKEGFYFCSTHYKKRVDKEEENIVEEVEVKTEKKVERPRVSQQKQMNILKEQNFECRGPGKDDNEEYECLMNKYKVKFSDKKSPDPEYDHIERWKTGGNDSINLQALCPNCHKMKTISENMIHENCPRMQTIYKSLSKPKYGELNLEMVDISDSDSDSDSDFENILMNKRFLFKR